MMLEPDGGLKPLPSLADLAKAGEGLVQQPPRRRPGRSPPARRPSGRARRAGALAGESTPDRWAHRSCRGSCGREAGPPGPSSGRSAARNSRARRRRSPARLRGTSRSASAGSIAASRTAASPRWRLIDAGSVGLTLVHALPLEDRPRRREVDHGQHVGELLEARKYWSCGSAATIACPSRRIGFARSRSSSSSQRSAT